MEHLVEEISTDLVSWLFFGLTLYSAFLCGNWLILVYKLFIWIMLRLIQLRSLSPLRVLALSLVDCLSFFDIVLQYKTRL